MLTSLTHKLYTSDQEIFFFYNSKKKLKLNSQNHLTFYKFKPRPQNLSELTKYKI